MNYNPNLIEKKWQKIWEDNKTFKAIDNDSKPKFYSLVEFPYPSGAGLHVGHIRAYSSLEVISRKKRLEGFNVLFPIGWDAFGLPTENYAIQTGKHPRIVTDANIEIFKQQLKSTGFSFDWDREIDTTDPNYYKWTQWIFLQLFKHNLAFKDTTYVNFCEHDKVVLANEESQNGICDRCGNQVIQLEKDVWFLKIREYAEKLLDEIPNLDFLPRIKTEQDNWIGKSVGAEVDFNISGTDTTITVFTTRPDTLYGTTFMVIAPEHPILETFSSKINNMDAIKDYQEKAKRKTEFDRVQLAKDKTGVCIDGLSVINPITKKEMPIWVSDYVMMGYGTGAVMGVPAHDSRDYEFATKFNIPIVYVIKSENNEEIDGAYDDVDNGIMINSDIINGLTPKVAIDKMISYLEENNLGKKKINYKMKDWAFNRQRYWGEPIPIIHCEDCGMVPVPENELPVLLPDVENYQPTDTGESPLANISEWVNTKCPNCGKDAKRETDTMPQWAGSSWYFLRYIDPNNSDTFASKENLKYWGMVDWYNGGMEHVTRHLIYSRFWHRFLYDIGVVPFKEPYKKRTAQGLVLGSDGEKMSKSRGNVINPNEIIDNYGADALRTYTLFIGEYEKPAVWSDESLRGCKRFLDRVWKLQEIVTEENNYSEKHLSLMHKTIKKVSLDIDAMKFNTAIAQLMTTINEFYSDGFVTKEELKTFITLLYPIAPHICEEIWENQKYEGMLNQTSWPTWDEDSTIDKVIEIPIQINGKMKGKISVPRDADINIAKEAIQNDKNLSEFLKDKNIVKEIFVPGKIFNLVVK